MKQGTEERGAENFSTTCKTVEMLFIPRSAASFLNYAVGPWVSVARREAALARGNPVKTHGAMEYWSDGVMDFMSLLITLMLQYFSTPES